MGATRTEQVSSCPDYSKRRFVRFSLTMRVEAAKKLGYLGKAAQWTNWQTESVVQHVP
jgi:hypothetical protein